MSIVQLGRVGLLANQHDIRLPIEFFSRHSFVNFSQYVPASIRFVYGFAA